MFWVLLACAEHRIRADVLADALHREPDRYVVIDVRSDSEWFASGGHIADATHLAWPGIQDRAAEIVARPDQTVVLVCFTGHRSRWAMEAVDAAVEGPVLDLRGGMLAWWGRRLPVVVEATP